MVRHALSTFGLSISVSAVVAALVPSATLGAGARTTKASRAAQCESMFATSQELEAAAVTAAAKAKRNAQASVASSSVTTVDPRSAIVVRSQEPSSELRDFTSMGNASNLGAATPSIPMAFVELAWNTRTSEGDFIDLKIYTKGNPRLASSSSHRLGSAVVQSPAIGYGNSSRNAVVEPAKSHALVTESESRMLVRALITEKEADGARLGADSVNMMVDMLHREPETLRRALEYAEEKKARGANYIGEAPITHLSSVGLARYFKFRPSGSSVDVEARVLDINSKKNPDVYNILVEWMAPEISSGPRHRGITSISVEELATLRILNETDRKQIATNFEDMLSPNEIKIRRFAGSLGIKTVGIAQHDPNGLPFEVRGGRVNMILDPMTAMTSSNASMSRARFESKFGSVPDLFTASELNNSNVNMYDVTSRLNPGFVLKRVSADRSGATFAFVITEDGQLKIAAHFAENSYSKPSFLRLAQGRRIFAKGMFEVDSTGSIRVLRQSGSPELIGYATDPSVSDHASARLIAAAFASQAGRRVSAIANEFVSWDPLEGFSNVSSGKNQWSSSEFYGSAHQAQRGKPESYVPPSSSGHASTNRSSGSEAAHLTWDSSTSAKPLSYKTWFDEMRKSIDPGLQDGYPTTKLAWSHYVLKSNANMSKDAIRKNYRKLASRFHSDHRGNNINDREDLQNVNVAWQTIEEDLNGRGL